VDEGLDLCSRIQNPGLLRASRDLLGIKGIKEIPDKISLREIQAVIDLGGINQYVNADLSPLAVSIAGVSTYLQDLVDQYPATAIKNTSKDKEIRLLAAYSTIGYDAAGAAADAGAIINIEVHLNNYCIISRTAFTVVGTRRYYVTASGQLQTETNASIEARPTRWPEWIPSDHALRVRVTKSGAVWPANTVLTTQIICVEYPKFFRVV